MKLESVFPVVCTKLESLDFEMGVVQDFGFYRPDDSQLNF